VQSTEKGVVEVLSNADLRLTSKWLVTSGITFIKKTMYQSPLRKPEFALLCLANLFGDFTQYLPYIYLPDMMGGVGISLVDASFSISIMGFSNMLGRITNGIILDWSHINTFSFICWSFISSGTCWYLIFDQITD
jgi:predicted MFS family arabinose efflux permease